MRRRRLALLMAFSMLFTSIPTNGMMVYAAEDFAEELIIEDECTEDGESHEHTHSDSADDGVVIEGIDIVGEESSETEDSAKDAENGVEIAIEAIETETGSEEETSEKVKEVSAVAVQEEAKTLNDGSVLLTGISLNQDKEITVSTFEFYDKYKEIVTSLSPSAIYSDDSESPIGDWELYTSDSARIRGTTDNGEYAYAILADEEGSLLNCTDSTVLLDTGSYAINMYLDDLTALRASKAITIEGVPEGTQDLTGGISVSDRLDGYAKKLYTFTASATEAYKIGVSYDYVSLTWRLYKAEDNSFTEVTSVNDEYILEAGAQYVLVMQNIYESDTAYSVSIYQSGVSITSVELQSEVNTTSWDAGNVLFYLPITVHYSDGSVEGLNWVYGGGDRYGTYCKTGSELQARLYDAEGNQVYLPALAMGEVLPEGSYKLAVTDLENRITPVYVDVNVSGVSLAQADLMECGSAEYNVWYRNGACYTITADQTEEYMIKVSPYDKDTRSSLYVYEISGSEYIYKYAEEYCWGDYSCSVSLEAGKQYLVVLCDNAGYSSCGIISLREKNRITGISIAEELEFDAFNFSDQMESIPVTVTYKDGTSDTFRNWYYTNVYDENTDTYYDALYRYTEEGDQIIITLLKSGQMVDVPYWSSETGFYGDAYSLQVYVKENEELSLTLPLSISAVPEGAYELDYNTEVEYTVDRTEDIWMKAEIETAGSYVLKLQNTEGTGMTEYHVYSLKDGVCTYQDYYEIEERQTINIPVDAASGEIIAVCVSAQQGEFYETQKGTAMFTDRKQVASLALPEKIVCDALKLDEVLRASEVTVTYNDATETTAATTETISKWNITYRGIDSENGYDGVFCGLKAVTQEGVEIRLELWDSNGNLVSLPYFTEEVNPFLPLGELKLVASVDGEETEYTQTVTTVLPTENAVELGKEYTADTSDNRKVVYSYRTSENESGEYVFYDKLADYDNRMAIYRYDEANNRLQMMEYEYWDGILAENLEADTLYYFCSKTETDREDGIFTLKATPQITSVEILADHIPDELIANFDKFSPNSIDAKVTYSDGTYEILQAGSYDMYRNSIKLKYYGTDEDGNMDESQSYKYSRLFSNTGKYYIAAVADMEYGKFVDAKAVTTITMYEAAARHSFDSATNKIDLSCVGDFYTAALYTADTDGIYTFSPDTYLAELDIYDLAGTKMQKKWVDAYSVQAELEEGETYLIAMKAEDSCDFTLSVKADRTIGQAAIIIDEEKELIAGLDTLSSSDFSVSLEFENGETAVLNTTGDYADGNGFYYEIINLATGEKVDPSQPLAAGQYQVTAIQRTYSAIFNTGSGINRKNTAVARTGSAIYGDDPTVHNTGSSIHTSGSAIYNTNSALFNTGSAIKSEPVIITVSALDISTLPVLTEEVAETVTPNGSRQLFAFTPQKNAYYNLESASSLDWKIYSVTETGLSLAGGTLNAGETYVVYINKLPYRQQITMTSDVQVLLLDTVTEVQLASGESAEFVFVPASDGSYLITADASTEEANSFTQLTIGSSYEYGYGKVENAQEMTAETVYSVKLNNYSGLTHTYQVKAENAAVITPVAISVTPKSTEGLVADLASFYNLQDLFDVTLEYSDGSSRKVDLYNCDVFGNLVEGSFGGYITGDETSQTQRYWIYCNDLVKKVDLVFSTENKMPTLTNTESLAMTVSDSRTEYYNFKVNESGYYYIYADGLNESYTNVLWADSDSSKENVYYLGKDIEHISYTLSYGNEVGTAYTLNAVKTKNVKSMKLLTEADPCLPEIESAGKGMTAEVTYTDGTKAVIDGSMTVDAFGNRISAEAKILTNSKVRVYLSCGTGLVYCDVDRTNLNTLPSLTADIYTEVAVDNSKYCDEVLMAFTPEESGVYTFAWQGGEMTSIACVYNTNTYSADEIPAALKAGQTYVVYLEVYPGTDESIEIKPVRMDVEYCVYEHTWAEEKEIDKEATCGEAGYKSIHCVLCGMIDESTIETIPATGNHSWNEGRITLQPTCIQKGTKVYTCEVCGETKEEELDYADHVWDTDYTVDVEPTCSSLGSKSIHCSVCDVKQKGTDTEVPMTAHTWDAGTVTKEPTCIQEGIMTYICTVCGTKKTEAIDKIAHDYSVEVLVTAPTCDTTGLKRMYCSVCNEADTETEIAVEATGHTWTLTETEDASCSTAGHKVYTCDVCGDEKTELIAALGHDWAEEKTVDTQSTCTTTGSKSIHCERCGVSQDGTAEDLELAEHTWEEEKTVDVAATCETAGQMSTHCAVCDAVKKDSAEEIAALGHNYSESYVKQAATCTAEGVLAKICLTCREEVTESIAMIDHVYGDWEVQTAAACTTDGLQTKTCASCRAIISEAIPATGHDYDADDDGEDDVLTKPAEGENRGEEYKICAECDNKVTVRVIPSEAEQSNITSAADTVSTADGDYTEAVSAVTGLDNQLLIDSDNVSVVEDLEEKLTTSSSEDANDAAVGQTTTVDADGNVTTDVTVTGAAVTVAAAIQDGTVDASEKETYAAQVEVTEATVGSNKAGQPTYTVDISLYIVDSTGTKVNDEAQQLAAPITVTMPIPEDLIGADFKLYHIVDEVEVEISYTLNADNTITFRTPSLSPFAMHKTFCAPGKHEVADDAWTVVTAATCSKAGTRIGTCSICQYEAVDGVIPMTDHEFDEGSVTKEATCTEAGIYTKTCRTCYVEENTSIAATGHSYGAWTVAEAASCTAEGKETRTCSTCEHTDERTIAMTAHKYQTYTVEATCTSAGETGLQCTICQSKKGVTEIPAVAHEMEVISTTAATCVSRASTVSKCKNCDYQETVYGDLAEGNGQHTWSAESVETKAATCTKTGIKTVTCTLCGAEKELTIPALSHDWVDEGITTEPTCTEPGVRSYNCSGCDETRTEAIPAANHNWATDKTVDTEATCTAVGTMSTHCTECGAVKADSEETIPMTDHAYESEYTVDWAATCSKAGQKSIHCADCDAIKENSETEIPTLAHKLQTVVDKKATCGAKGSQHVKCKNCDYAEKATDIPATGKHNYQNYKVTKAATVTSTGVKTGTCTVCGAKDNQTTPKLEGTITLTTKTLPLQLKKSVNLSQIVTGLAKGDKIVKCTSAKTKFVTVSGTDKITGKKVGKAVVTITLLSGKTATVTINVQKTVKTTSIKVNVNKTLSMKIGDKIQVTATVSPITSLQKVTYTSSNKKVATVSKNGLITAKKSGKAKITVKSGSKKYTITVNVQKVQPTKIQNVKATKTLKVKKFFTLKPTLYPKGSEAKFTFKSLNTKVATVNKKGKVTAKKKGTATIVVKAGNLTAQCVVTVK